MRNSIAGRTGARSFGAMFGAMQAAKSSRIVASLWRRQPQSEGLARNWPSPVLVGLSAVGVFALPYLVLRNAAESAFGFDTWAYWSVNLQDLYGRSQQYGALGGFLYTPPIGMAFSLFQAVPYWQFAWLWLAVLIGTLAWLGGRWTLALLAFPPIALDLYHGNIHLLLAAAIVLGFRHPWSWSFVLLTKATCGVGLLWFVIRREWRALWIALGATAAVALASFVLAPGLWAGYVSMIIGDASSAGPMVWVRVGVAALVVVVGALRGWRWVVPVAAVIAAPVLWWLSPAILAGVVPLGRPGSDAATTTSSGGAVA